MKFLWGVIVTLIVIVGAGLAVIWTGAYNIAATDPHFDPVRWALDTTMHNSVEARADAQAPESFTEEQVRDGFRSYDETCVMCHGAPGVEQKEFAKGMRPEPPNLAEEAGEWAPNELFWIVRNGVKMSGMPAMGPTHEDSHLWAVVAFLQRLPDMDAATYAEMRETVSVGHHAGEEEAHAGEAAAEQVAAGHEEAGGSEAAQASDAQDRATEDAQQ